MVLEVTKVTESLWAEKTDWRAGGGHSGCVSDERLKDANY